MKKKDEKSISIEKELDVNNLNSVIKTSKKLLKIIYFVMVVALILLITYIFKEWKILKFIGELLKVISPIFIGFFLAWLLNPLVEKLERRKIPRVGSCIIVYLGLILILALIIGIIVPALISQVGDFIAVLPSIIQSFADNCNKFIDRISDTLNINTFNLKKELLNSLTTLSKNITTNLPSIAIGIGKGIVNASVSILLGLMIGFYILFDFKKINILIKKKMPESWRTNYSKLITELNNSLRNYIQGILLVMLLVFVTQSIGLTLAGLEAPLLFALFCAVTDIIPYFGPYIGAIPAVIVGFTISPVTGICVIIAIVIVQLLENNFYQPLIMGKTMSLHPVTIMLGLLIFQHFFGIIGMIIATPTIACIKVIYKFIKEKANIQKHVEKVISTE